MGKSSRPLELHRSSVCPGSVPAFAVRVEINRRMHERPSHGQLLGRHPHRDLLSPLVATDPQAADFDSLR